jgi:hypothetical protein
MTFHVDIVKNDWLAGLQYPLATLTLGEEGQVAVNAQHPERWDALIKEINASGDPESALANLHIRYAGSHLFATPRHEETDCPFHGPPVYLQGEEASGSASRVVPA